MLDFDWLIKKQYAKLKMLESREIIIAKTNFRAFQQFFAKQQKSNYDSPAKEKYADQNGGLKTRIEGVNCMI